MGDNADANVDADDGAYGSTMLKASDAPSMHLL